MLGANLFVAAELRFFARLDQGAAQPIREIVPCQMTLPREDLKFRRRSIIARLSFVRYRMRAFSRCAVFPSRTAR